MSSSEQVIWDKRTKILKIWSAFHSFSIWAYSNSPTSCCLNIFKELGASKKTDWNIADSRIATKVFDMEIQ